MIKYQFVIFSHHRVCLFYVYVCVYLVCIAVLFLMHGWFEACCSPSNADRLAPQHSAVLGCFAAVTHFHKTKILKPCEGMKKRPTETEQWWTKLGFTTTSWWSLTISLMHIKFLCCSLLLRISVLNTVMKLYFTDPSFPRRLPGKNFPIWY